MRQTDAALKKMVLAQDEGCATVTPPRQCGQAGTDAWSRAARQVRERAALVGLALDDAELALQDVRDLQIMAAALAPRKRLDHRLKLGWSGFVGGGGF